MIAHLFLSAVISVLLLTAGTLFGAWLGFKLVDVFGDADAEANMDSIPAGGLGALTCFCLVAYLCIANFFWLGWW